MPTASVRHGGGRGGTASEGRQPIPSDRRRAKPDRGLPRSAVARRGIRPRGALERPLWGKANKEFPSR